MEQKYFGYWGRILRVDLSNRKIWTEEPDPSWYRTYFGGGCFALYYLLREIPKGIDAFAPENVIAFMTSPLTGTNISGQSRHTCASLSPLTGGLADSQCGGWWAAELKFASWDGIVVTGKADQLVSLLIEDDAVEIIEAEYLRGKTTGDVQEHYNETYPKARVLQCGPAGENLVRYACVTADLKNFNGRGGLGAVMGSKNLRAIVVKGTNRPISIANEDGLREIRNWFNKGIKTHPAISVHHDLGTSKGIVPVSIGGMLPTYNFQDGSFEHAEDIGGETMKRVLNGKTETCFGCGVSCKRSVEGTNGVFTITRQYGGPEYETIGLMGSNLGIGDTVSVAALNQKCNEMGLDTISTGAAIAWAVECYEKGLLTKADTHGIHLDWNAPEVYIKIIEDIVVKKDFGALLAEGSKRAALKIGKDSINFTIQVKGQDAPSHEPRGKWGVGLGYAVSNTGADHLQAAHDPCFTTLGEYTTDANWVDLQDLSPVGIIAPVPAQDLSAEKVRMFVRLQQIWGFHDVLDWCIFTAVPEFRAISLNQLAQITEFVTGWRTSLFELMKAGERWVTMGRAFNIKHGLTVMDDTLPPRFFEPLRGGTLKGVSIDKKQFEEAKQLYYAMVGWDSKSKPTRGKLVDLNVEWIWEQIKDI